MELETTHLSACPHYLLLSVVSGFEFGLLIDGNEELTVETIRMAKYLGKG